MIASIVTPITLGIAVTLVLQILIWRCWPSKSPRMGLLVILNMIGMAVSLFACFMIGKSEFPEYASILYIYVLVTIGYCFGYSVVARSVSVTILIRLRGSANESVPFELLMKEYSYSSRFEDRLILMEEAGMLQIQDDLVEITPKGRRMVLATKTLASCLGTFFEG